MHWKKGLALATLLVSMLGIGAAPALAHSANGGTVTNYGCTINPNAPGCASIQPYQPSSPPPSALPTTGGGVPAGDPALPALAGLGLVALGLGVRRIRR